MSDIFQRADAQQLERPAIEVGQTWANDDFDNPCFGCRQHGEPGLRLTFTRISEHEAETRWTAEPTYAGWPTVVHGGIQCALLDEVMGACVGMHYTHASMAIVTMGMDVRFRRPTPVGEELVAVARLDRIEDDRDHHITAEIRVGDGTVTTTATSRWRKLR